MNPISKSNSYALQHWRQHLIPAGLVLALGLAGASCAEEFDDTTAPEAETPVERKSIQKGAERAEQPARVTQVDRDGSGVEESPAEPSPTAPLSDLPPDRPPARDSDAYTLLHRGEPALAPTNSQTTRDER